MKVYLVDYIGMHCGMHYYNDAFCRVLRNRFMDIDYAFLCEGNDIHERQVDGVTVSQINEAGFFVSQDKAEQHQVVPQQTTYFAQPVSLVLV